MIIIGHASNLPSFWRKATKLRSQTFNTAFLLSLLFHLSQSPAATAANPVVPIDFTTQVINAQEAPAPPGFPPFPQGVDIPATLNSEVQSGALNESLMSANGEPSAARSSDSAAHALLAQNLLANRNVVQGFQELRKAVELGNWKLGDNPNEALCHRMLGDILMEYALKAKDTGRGSTGMQRLLNAYTEYRRSVFLDPSDKAATTGLLNVSLQIVRIQASFNNLLALASASLLAGDNRRSEEYYHLCISLANQKGIAVPADLQSKISAELTKLHAENNGSATSPNGLSRADMDPFVKTTAGWNPDDKWSTDDKWNARGTSPGASIPKAGTIGSDAGTIGSDAGTVGTNAPYVNHSQAKFGKNKSVHVQEEDETIRVDPFGTPSAYLDNVRHRLKKEWHLTHIQTGKFPSVTFAVDGRGDLTRLSISTSSGNADIDNDALNVVRRVAPFANAPAGLGEISYTFEDKPDSADLTDYMRELRRKISHDWHPPHDTQQDHIVASFKVRRDGSIDDPHLTQSSQSEKRNQASLEAIRNSAPFQHLPEGAPESVDIQFHFDHTMEE